MKKQGLRNINNILREPQKKMTFGVLFDKNSVR